MGAGQQEAGPGLEADAAPVPEWSAGLRLVTSRHAEITVGCTLCLARHTPT